MKLNKSDAAWLSFLKKEFPGDWYKIILSEFALVSGNVYMVFSIINQTFRMYDSKFVKVISADMDEAKRFYKKHFKLKNFT